MKSIFLKTILIYAISITICNISYSQESDKKSSDSLKAKNEVSNSLKAKEWAIMFGIGTDFTLTNFDDAVIAVKYHISPKSALRLDFNVNYLNDKFTGNNSNNNFNTESRQQIYGGYLAFLYYINPKEKFNIYFNLGINYSFYEESFSDYENGTNGYDKTWLTGPKVGAGAEYFIFRSFSVFAEYNYFFGFGERENYSFDGIVSVNLKSDITSFSKDNVKFGLSVYF